MRLGGGRRLGFGLGGRRLLGLRRVRRARETEETLRMDHFQRGSGAVDWLAQSKMNEGGGIIEELSSAFIHIIHSTSNKGEERAKDQRSGTKS